jgi:hypothetical protein
MVYLLYGRSEKIMTPEEINKNITRLAATFGCSSEKIIKIINDFTSDLFFLAQAGIPIDDAISVRGGTITLDELDKNVNKYYGCEENGTE